jgi:hypothetical protein
LKYTRAIVQELLASSNTPVEYKNEDEGKNKNISNRDNLDQITFSNSSTLWKIQGILSDLKNRFKDTYYIIVNIFFKTLKDLEY